MTCLKLALVLLFTWPCQAQPVTVTGNIPYPKNLLRTGNELKHWSMARVREHKDYTVNPGGTTVMEKDSRARSWKLGYNSKRVEKTIGYAAKNKIEDIPIIPQFSGTLDMTGAVLPAIVAILVDDKATLTVDEDVSARPAGVTGPAFHQTYPVNGTALWNPISYKEFDVPLPPGRKYKLILDYENVANLTEQYGGKTDVDGVSVYLCLTPLEIVGIAEKDQPWNKAHSPKEPGYYDDAKEGSTKLWNTVFVAVEPSSSKVELVATTTARGTNKVPLLVGVMDKDGNILSDVATVGADGKAEISFTPAHSVNDGPHKICLGYDKNGNSKLSIDEIVTENLPLDKTFYVRAVTQADYDSEMFYFHWKIQWARLGGYSVASSFVRYFDAADATLMDSTGSTAITIPITRKDLTHIAGSPYLPKVGNTIVTKFILPKGSAASTKIGKNFNVSGKTKGMLAVVHETWANNAATLQAPFTSDPTLQTWTSPPITISVSNGSIDLNSANDEDLEYAFGTAGITGTLKFKLKRDKTDPNQVLIDELDADCVVEDLYDFDFTRLPTSRSHHASILQIGWQPPAREGGRIFATKVIIQEHYTSGTSGVDYFNEVWPLTLGTMPPVPPPPPPSNK